MNTRILELRRHLEPPVWGRAFRASAVAGAVVGLAGCPSPDPEAKYNRFIDDTDEDRQELLDSIANSDGQLLDITGQYLFALSTNISPGTPMQFIATVDMELASDGLSGSATIDLQPLSLGVGQTTMPREQVGEVIPMDPSVDFDAGGAFTYAFPDQTTVVGEANPVTGSEIVSMLSLAGVIFDETLWCGSVGGSVLAPITADLTGSTFAAELLPQGEITPDLLPTDIIVDCPSDE